MTLSDITQLVTALAAVGGTVISGYALFTVKQVKHLTNSLKDELVAVTRSDAHREGYADGAKVATDDARQAGIQKGIEIASTVQP